MATPFEYSRIHPTVLCISRSSDNTNHPKYSLSLFPPIFSHLRSRGRCLPEPHAPRSGIKTFEDEISPTLLVSPLLSLSLSLSINPARISSMSGLTRVFSSPLSAFLRNTHLESANGNSKEYYSSSFSIPYLDNNGWILYFFL